MTERCPSCRREITSIQDYDSVTLIAVSLLPERPHGELSKEINKIIDHPRVEKYLRGLEIARGYNISQEDITPPFEEIDHWPRMYKAPTGQKNMALAFFTDTDQHAAELILGKLEGNQYFFSVAVLAKIKYAGRFAPIGSKVGPGMFGGHGGGG